MLVGPHATAKEVENFRQIIQKDPRNYIAQPTLAISTAPTLCKGRLEPRTLICALLFCKAILPLLQPVV